MHIRLRDLTAPMRWGRSSDGLVVMLAGFFDDSGTHAGSPIAVWGGLIGSLAEFEKLDTAWRALLAAPLNGKPPLEKFSLANCIAGEGEFETYNRGERDHIRYLFRNLLAPLDIAPLAYAVDAKAWDSLLTPQQRGFLGDAQNKAFFGCLEAVHGYSVRVKEHMTLHFDAGQKGRALNSVLAAYEDAHPSFNHFVSVTFSPVKGLTGLQAADMIAGEAFRYYSRNPINQPPEPDDPHLKDLVKKSGAIFMYYGREEIPPFIREWEKAMGVVLQQLMRAGL